MANLILPHRWTRQPSAYPGIAAEYRQYLTSLALPTVGYDVARGVSVAQSVVSVPNVGLAFDIGGSYNFGAADDGSVLPLGTDVTVLMQAYMTGSGGSPVFDNSALDSSDFNCYLPFNGDSNVYWRWAGDSGSQSLNVGGLSFNRGDWWAFTAGPRGMEIWQNFARVASGGPGSGGSRTPAGTPVKWTDVRMGAWFVFSKQLPESLLGSGNYWQVLQPLRRRLYFAASAGANLTLDGNPGLLRFVGQSATLTLTNNLALTAEPGRVLFVGQQANLAVTANLALAAEPGLLRFQGQSADLTLSNGLVLDTQPGVVRFVGQQASLALTENLALATAPGYVRLHGQVADLSVTGPIVITGEPGHLRFRGLAAEITLTGGGDTDIATNPKLIARHYPNLEFRPVGRKRWKVEGREAELDILPSKLGLGIGPVIVPPLPPRPKAPVTKLPVAPKKAPPPPPALVIAPPVLPPPAPIDDPRVPALERAVEAIRAEYDVTLRRLLQAEGEAASLRDELRAAHDGFAADIAALRKEVDATTKLARQARNLAIRR